VKPGRCLNDCSEKGHVPLKSPQCERHIPHLLSMSVSSKWSLSSGYLTRLLYAVYVLNDIS
jgi:hypothetical protein